MTSRTNLTAIPDVLKSFPNWVNWVLEEKDGKGTKLPIIPGTNQYASSTDPATWTDFETAVKYCSAVNCKSGIGFVIGGKAIEAELVGFDLDGCRNPATGDISPWAEEIISLLDSYTEFTPSGFGVRVWVKGKLPGKDRVFNLDPGAGFGEKVKIEVFDHARYFTVTGDTFL
jgi:putative DNA primase/helicase